MIFLFLGSSLAHLEQLFEVDDHGDAGNDDLSHYQILPITFIIRNKIIGKASFTACCEENYNLSDPPDALDVVVRNRWRPLF